MLPIVKAFKDISNYREWIRVIKRERRDANSLYNKYRINHNIFYNIYVGVTLPDEDKFLPDNVKQLRVMESLAPVHRYIDNDLGFAGYIVPEMNQVFDDEGNPTITYVAVYRFAFNQLSLKYIITRLLILGGVIFAALKLPWTEWIST